MKKWGVCVICILLLCVIETVPVFASEKNTQDYLGNMTEELDFSKLDHFMRQDAEDSGITFSELVKELLYQEKPGALKLFGKRIALGEKLEDEEEEPDADSTDTAVHETKAEVENILPSDSKMQRRDVSVKDAAEANEKKDSKDGTDTKEQTSIVRKNIDETDSEKVSFGQRITSKFHDITNKIKGIRGKLADLSGQAGKIKAALTDEHNRNSVSAIWKELKYLLKHSRFRKIDTELNFALWEPSATGQALGILAMFPAIYQYDIGIYPDFEADKTYVKGTFLVKGHIRLVHVLISGIRLLKERDIRNFIKKFFK